MPPKRVMGWDVTPGWKKQRDSVVRQAKTKYQNIKNRATNRLKSKAQVIAAQKKNFEDLKKKLRENAQQAHDHLSRAIASHMTHAKTLKDPSGHLSRAHSKLQKHILKIRKDVKTKFTGSAYKKR